MNKKQQLVQRNTELNIKETNEKRVVLESYPRFLFVQLDAPCNQECLFCSRPATYAWFDLAEYKARFGKALEPALERAERINLTGSGELLLLPEAKRILAYFNSFPYAEKMFATNGSTLTPKMADFILASGNRYVIHVSLHSRTPGCHAVMTQSKNYEIVKYNLEHLARVRARGSAVRLNLIFLLTTKNYQELPGFVEFAARFGADRVVVYYNFVYRLDQKELSAYFIKEQANEAVEKAREQAHKRGMGFSAPPAFGTTQAPTLFCGEAWSQLMINPDGDVITCDIAKGSSANMAGKKFMEVWNGEYFTNIRQLLATNQQTCSAECFRANPSSVDDFRSHFIVRGRSEEEVKEFLKGS